MRRPLLLDLFCKAGGAGMGYHRAGFDVVGVDIEPQKHFPLLFVQSDAFDFLRRNARHFDAIHASPPCQAYSAMTPAGSRGNHPDLVGPIREALRATGKPYIIENVPGAPLEDPTILCGAMFPDLKVYRHRLFESNVALVAPPHPKHIERVPKTGRPPSATGWMSIAGHFPNLPAAQLAMGIDWMDKMELAQAIPPAYTEYLGGQLLAALTQREAA